MRTSNIAGPGKLAKARNFSNRGEFTARQREGTIEFQELYSGLIRLHILHHACKESIFGREMIQELTRHGYRVGAGTLYPMLHGMERQGWLRSSAESKGGGVRRVYSATAPGKKALLAAKKKVQELSGELFDETSSRSRNE